MDKKEIALRLIALQHQTDQWSLKISEATEGLRECGVILEICNEPFSDWALVELAREILGVPNDGHEEYAWHSKTDIEEYTLRLLDRADRIRAQKEPRLPDLN